MRSLTGEGDKLDKVEPVSGPAEEIKSTEARDAIAKTKSDKASGPSGVVSEMLKAAGAPGVQWVTRIVNGVIREGRIPADWTKSWLVNVYKGEGDALACGSYRGIKLLDQAVKILERVQEKRIRERVTLDEMQFGFQPGRGTIDAIFYRLTDTRKDSGEEKMSYGSGFCGSGKGVRQSAQGGFVVGFAGCGC